MQQILSWLGPLWRKYCTSFLRLIKADIYRPTSRRRTIGMIMIMITIKGGYRRAEKSRKVLLMKTAKLGAGPGAGQEQTIGRPGAGWEQARSRLGAMQ